MPTKKPSGIEITSAQGQEITKNVNALCKATFSEILAKAGKTAITIAIKITIGV